jgi:hypothetical protein
VGNSPTTIAVLSSDSVIARRITAMSTVKEKVRINEAEFEIELKPVLSNTTNDPMVLNQPLPTPDSVLERVPAVERLPRWEDGGC